jgi:2,3-bisphosphoglycerate-independent phosphoglycerate mutase
MPNLAKRPVVLIVRDGWGHNPSAKWDKANAIKLAHVPVEDRLLAEFPHALVRTSGEEVGLPVGVMGNSEVGHQNIGAGRIVDQEVMRITRTVRDGSFFTNPVLLGAFEHAKKTGGAVHMIGLFSDGRVHSDMDHAFAIVDLCKQVGFDGRRFFVHCLMDGRDTPPQSGVTYIEQTEKKLKESGIGRISTVCGRYYAMDRDNRWDRVEKAYQLLTAGKGEIYANAVTAVQHYYANATESSRSGDEFVVPSIIAPAGKPDPAQLIKSGDAVIFFNYRGDRPREITKAFMFDDEAWKGVPNGGFNRGTKLTDLYYATMAQYETGLPVKVIFGKPPKMKNILGDYISALGLRQFRCAETEKYPHVTFFFNDYRDEPFPGEDRLLVPSPRDVTTYDQKPEMSARPVTEEMLRRVNSGDYDVMVLNYANGDMVGHTGIIPAAVKAVETVDECVGKVVDAVLAKGGALVVTADHGNCEQMVDPTTNGPHTAHTTYDVDLIVVDDRLKNKGVQLRTGGTLADIAPTLLALAGLAKPPEMTGESLVPAGTLSK